MCSSDLPGTQMNKNSPLLGTGRRKIGKHFFPCNRFFGNLWVFRRVRARTHNGAHLPPVHQDGGTLRSQLPSTFSPPAPKLFATIGKMPPGWQVIEQLEFRTYRRQFVHLVSLRALALTKFIFPETKAYVFVFAVKLRLFCTRQSL